MAITNPVELEAFDPTRKLGSSRIFRPALRQMRLPICSLYPGVSDRPRSLRCGNSEWAAMAG